MRVYSRPGDSDSGKDPDIDYRAEGSDPYLNGEKRSPTDEGYDEAAHRERAGTVQLKARAAYSVRPAEAPTKAAFRSRNVLDSTIVKVKPIPPQPKLRSSPRYGRDPEHFDEVMDGRNIPSPQAGIRNGLPGNYRIN